MKKIFYLSIVVSMILVACKKDRKPLTSPLLNDVPPDYISLVQKFVKGHVSDIDYNKLDLNNYRISKQKQKWYLRFPFKNKLLSTDFVLLQTDSMGNVDSGKMIHLEKIFSSNMAGDNTSYNGSIGISSLDRSTVVYSAITKGYIESFHSRLFATTNKEGSFPVPIAYDEMPEVVVVGYRPSASSDGGLSISDYMMLQSLFDGGSGSGHGAGGGGGAPGTGTSGSTGYGVYSPVDGGSYGNVTNNPTPPAHVEPNIVLYFDESFSRPAIDLNAWLKCFSNIPDAGATSSITLFGDLPRDDDPGAGINLWNGNTGHCFLQLSKTNGPQSVSQVIGFTAQSAGKAIVNSNAFVPSKIADNAGHKYNCSITIPLSANGLNKVISTIKSLADMAYSIVNYDCLDFALNVINAVRPAGPLVIDKVYDPNNPFSNIATGPKLYTLLQSMIRNGSVETPNILVGNSMYAGASHGPCY
jgi:hypothetical protein